MKLLILLIIMSLFRGPFAIGSDLDELLYDLEVKATHAQNIAEPQSTAEEIDAFRAQLPPSEIDSKQAAEEKRKKDRLKSFYEAEKKKKQKLKKSAESKENRNQSRMTPKKNHDRHVAMVHENPGRLPTVLPKKKVRN